MMKEINSNKFDSSSDQQRILITGVSGLVGRILFNYFNTTYPTKYKVFGLDQHENISPRYQIKDDLDFSPKPIMSVPSEQFFQCDITDRNELHKIIQQQQIDIIIHLAAILESHSNIEEISRVNIDGTKNIFEAPGVRRIIYASSVMTVFGYLSSEPYRSISNETFDDETMLANLHKLTVLDDPPLPYLKTPGDIAYGQSKIIGEQMAASVIKNEKKSIICVRFGWVNIYDQPGTAWYRTVWFSYRDVCSFMDKALQAPIHISGTYFAMSNNHRLWVDLDAPKRDLDFVPQDGAEKL